MEVRWQPPALLEQNGVITGYVVLVTDAVSGRLQEETVAGTEHMLLIEGVWSHSDHDSMLSYTLVDEYW